METIPRRNFNLHTILSELRTREFGRTIQILDSCTSTNDIAAQLASFGAPHGYVVLAEEQTQGRGRLGRTWASPRGGIWMTLVLRPPIRVDLLDGLPLIGAIAVAKAINSSLNTQANVRWPNDVVIAQRKIAGILAQTKFKGNEMLYALLGLGIDANFHSNALNVVTLTLTTLLDQLGSPVDREELVCSLLLELEYIYEMANSNREDELMESLRKLDCSRGRKMKIETENQKVLGVFQDYDSLTSVRVATPEGKLVHLETGSVVFVEYLGA